MTQISKALLRSLAVATRPTNQYPKTLNIPFPATQLVVDQRELRVAPHPKLQETFIEEEFLLFKVTQFTESLFKNADLTVPKGLPNDGNTCFIASVIQASVPFQKTAFEEKLIDANDQEKSVINSILSWIKNYENGKNTVNLEPILQILRKYGIYNGSQEDAAELLTWIGNYLPNPKVYYHQITKTAPLNAGEFIIEGEENKAQLVREIPLEVEREANEIKTGQTLLILIEILNNTDYVA